MNILITGGAGFIGSNFVKYWLSNHKSDRVYVYDKLTYAGNTMNLIGLEKLPNYKFIKGDICDADALEKSVVEFSIDTIVNFAAETHVDRSITGPAAFINSNIFGVFNILEIVKKFPNIRFHHISTDEVYGSLPLDDKSKKFSELTPYQPSSPYSASKASGDLLAKAYFHTYGLKITISNCSNNFGPYCYPEKLIPLAITRALNNEEIPVYGAGDQVRDWIYVTDHCKGIELILEKGEIGETYILGGDGEASNIDVIKTILKKLNKPESLIVHVGDRLGHDQRYAMDYSKAKSELGFMPEGNFETHLNDTIDWYINSQDWWLPLKPNADKIAEAYLNKRIN